MGLAREQAERSLAAAAASLDGEVEESNLQRKAAAPLGHALVQAARSGRTNGNGMTANKGRRAKEQERVKPLGGMPGPREISGRANRLPTWPDEDKDEVHLWQAEQAWQTIKMLQSTVNFLPGEQDCAQNFEGLRKEMVQATQEDVDNQEDPGKGGGDWISPTTSPPSCRS